MAALEEFTDLGDVVNIAAKVKEVESRLTAAQAQVKLFNSRERYFLSINAHINQQTIVNYKYKSKIFVNLTVYSRVISPTTKT